MNFAHCDGFLCLRYYQLNLFERLQKLLSIFALVFYFLIKCSCEWSILVSPNISKANKNHKRKSKFLRFNGRKTEIRLKHSFKSEH